MDAKTLGSRIAALRKERELTQKELAELLHVTDKAVSKWERGLNFPDLKTLEPLAATLGTTVIALLELEEASQQETVKTLSEISVQERALLLRELRHRAVMKIVMELLIGASLTGASWLFSRHGLYGLPQVLTTGMTGFVGVLIGSEIHALLKYKKLR